MSRLIDADELTNKLLTAIDCGKRNDMPTAELEAVLADTQTIQTVDAVEVVRCRDCKHSRPDKYGMWCRTHCRPTKENDFCSRGEKVTE